MACREMARWCGALAVLSITTLGFLRPASAQDIERSLAGIRLGSRSTTVLAKFGNPNDVVIGDIGIRQAPGGAGSSSSPAGSPGGTSGGLPNPMGGPGSKGMMPSMPSMPGMMGIPGAPSGPPSGSGIPGFPSDDANGPGGGGAGSGQGAYGQTMSTLSHQQEVTWVYNRKVGNNVVSYEFLIGPSGDVAQIRVSGYSGGNARTKQGVVLGSTYKEVVRTYGYPEEHEQVGNVLIASYKDKDHVSFQFLNQAGQLNPFSSGNKVIAITIATIE